MEAEGVCVGIGRSHRARRMLGEELSGVRKRQGAGGGSTSIGTIEARWGSRVSRENRDEGTEMSRYWPDPSHHLDATVCNSPRSAYEHQLVIFRRS